MSSDNSQLKISDDWETQVLWRLIARRSSPLVAFSRSGTGLPFYCVHSIAGDVRIFGKLIGALGPDQPLYGIQVPKEKMKPEFAASIEGIARDHVKTVLAFQPTGAFVLGGWSTGAIIALEMSQQLAAMGRDVPLLVAFDGAPSNTGAGLSHFDPRYFWKLLRNAPRWIADHDAASWSWRGFARRVADRLAFKRDILSLRFPRRHTLHRERVQELLGKEAWSNDQANFIRALWEAQRTYVPKPYFGRVVLYEAEVQPLFHLLQLRDAWAKITQQVETVRLPGGHGSMFREPGVSILATHLRKCLAEVQQPAQSAR
jgi:thioesterase domain-containing protein